MSQPLVCVAAANRIAAKLLECRPTQYIVIDGQEDEVKRIRALLFLCKFMWLTNHETCDMIPENFVVSFNGPSIVGLHNIYQGYRWEFNDPAEFDVFSVNHIEIDSRENGVISGISVPTPSGSKRHDPMVIVPSLELSAEDVPVIRVGISYTVDRAGYGDTSAYIFFRTEEKNFSAETYVSVKADVATTDGQLVEYIFDMTRNSLWTGTILGLRLDPYEAGPEGSGSFCIDYIRLEGTQPEADTETMEHTTDTESAPVPDDNTVPPSDAADPGDSDVTSVPPEDAGVPAGVYAAVSAGIVVLSATGAAIRLRRRKSADGHV